MTLRRWAAYCREMSLSAVRKPQQGADKSALCNGDMSPLCATVSYAVFNEAQWNEG